MTTSGIAPTKKLAKRLANFFGRRIGIIGVKTASLKKGYQPLTEHSHKQIPKNARRVGKKLVWTIEQNKKPKRLTYWWILFLRKHLLSRVIKNSPEQFSGVVPIWINNKWLKIEK